MDCEGPTTPHEPLVQSKEVLLWSPRSLLLLLSVLGPLGLQPPKVKEAVR